ncbi:hypothetical protein ACSQPA_004964 [Pseudomonas aeruginosa]
MSKELNKASVEQAGGDERDLQAEGAQEVPSPVSQEYDRHLISLLRKGEALPGHQEEAADEIERLRDWNDHLNNTVLPNILNPNFLMLMKGGERLLDLCTKDGKFIGVSLNDMKDVFDWMVTHARIAPDHAALAQPSQAIAAAPTYQFQSREIGESDWAPCDFRWYLYCSKSPEMDTRVVEVAAQPSPVQAEAEVERPIVSFEKYMQVMYDRDENAKRLDAALAEVKRLIGVCASLDSEKREIEHKRDSIIAMRDAALARVAELELKLDKSDYAYDNDRIHMRGLAARAIARAKVFDDGSDGADAESARSVVAILRELLAVGPAQAQHSVPEGYALIPVRETEAMHDAVMALLYKGVARTDTQKLLDAYIAAAPGKEVGHE